jgi:hypothetical protein
MQNRIILKTSYFQAFYIEKCHTLRPVITPMSHQLTRRVLAFKTRHVSQCDMSMKVTLLFYVIHMLKQHYTCCFKKTQIFEP